MAEADGLFISINLSQERHDFQKVTSYHISARNLPCLHHLAIVMWAQPCHLTTPGLAPWQSPGGNQEFLKQGGERVASRILHNLSFCCEENFNAHYLRPLHHLKCLKRVDILSMNLFTLILHLLVKKRPQNDGICSVLSEQVTSPADGDRLPSSVPIDQVYDLSMLDEIRTGKATAIVVDDELELGSRA